MACGCLRAYFAQSSIQRMINQNKEKNRINTDIYSYINVSEPNERSKNQTERNPINCTIHIVFN